MSNFSVKESVKLLPQEPGIYRFYDNSNKIIYIGKAKNLKKRVQQYFRNDNHLSAKTSIMVSKIAAFDHTVVPTETEALLLENIQIKQYKPRYNILLKDDKTYPWIVVKKEPFPRIFITRKVVKDGSKYYGPYGSTPMAYNIMGLIETLFPIRDCKLNLTEESVNLNKFKSCLSYHIGKCKAPCIALQDREEYISEIKNAESILKGDVADILKIFKEQMNSFSSRLMYEDAHEMKRRVDLLEQHSNKSLVSSSKVNELDIFSLIFEESAAFGNFMRIYNGNLVKILNLEFRVQLEESASEIMSLFIAEILNTFEHLSKEIVVSSIPDQEFSGVKIYIPERGEKKDLLNLSLKNAKIFRAEKIKQEEIISPDKYKNRVLESLRKELSLPKTPNHIECFDNSNIQGTNAVSACVVFKDALPSKKDYRHFNVKTVTGSDDFATMREVVSRRYKRVIEEGEPLPDLIIIDGGRGQLNAAWSVLQDLGIDSSVPIIGLAKRLEEVVVPGDPVSLFIDKNSSALKLMMRIRDEAHRFGIKHHRNKRSNAQVTTILSTIPGIGEKSIQKLLSKYKSVKNIKSVPLEELASLIGKKAAINLINQL